MGAEMRVLSFLGAVSLAALLSALQVQAQVPPATGSDQKAASGLTKRASCEASTQASKGENKRDQVQLCLAKARIDCLNQAVDQKIFGKQRAAFVNNCMGDQPTK